jgi:hypothetical protein
MRGIGSSRVKTIGEIDELARASDLAGVDGHVRLDWALANNGHGQLWPQNHRGVVLRLRPRARD